MRVVVTGACGFLGSHIVDALREHTVHEIVAVSDYRSDGTTGWAKPHPEIEIHRLDIQDALSVKRLRPDAIINAAALVSVPDSNDRPYSHWMANANSVAFMLALMPEVRFVQISTSEVFDGSRPPYGEGSRLAPSTPYGASKASAECAVHGYAKAGTVARIFNMFGPRQFPRAVIPRMVREALGVAGGSKAKARLYGPHGSRAFCYAPAVAKIIATQVLEEPRKLVQIASSKPIEIGALWSLVAREVGIDPALVDWQPLPANVSNVATLYGFSSAGYETFTEFPLEGLRATIKWMREHPNYASMEDYQ